MRITRPIHTAVDQVDSRTRLAERDQRLPAPEEGVPGRDERETDGEQVPYGSARNERTARTQRHGDVRGRPEKRELDE